MLYMVTTSTRLVASLAFNLTSDEVTDDSLHKMTEKLLFFFHRQVELFLYSD